MSADLEYSVATMWRQLPGADLHCRLLEDQYAVYNCGSGDTHILDPVAALILEQIRERGCTTTELAREVGVLLNIRVNDEVLTKLQETLHQLAKLDLIESVNP